MTGTSVLGIKYKDGIMMAADTLGNFWDILFLSIFLDRFVFLFLLFQLLTEISHVSVMLRGSTRLVRTPWWEPRVTCPTTRPSSRCWRSWWLRSTRWMTTTDFPRLTSMSTSASSCITGDPRWTHSGTCSLWEASVMDRGSFSYFPLKKLSFFFFWK